MIDGIEENGVWYVRERRSLEPETAPDSAPLSRGKPHASTSAKKSPTSNKDTRPTSVRFENGWFVPTLVVILAPLILFNVIALAGGAVFSLVPLAIQIPILLLLYKRNPLVVTLIRAWALLLIIAGVSQSMSSLFRLIDYGYFEGSEVLGAEITGSIAIAVFGLGVGIPVFFRVKKYIIPVHDSELPSEAVVE